MVNKHKSDAADWNDQISCKQPRHVERQVNNILILLKLQR